MQSEKKLIAVKDLSKNYGKIRALDKISFNIIEGKITGFLGPNGAGKTTTIKCLLGLININSGVIEVNGRRVHNLKNLKFKIRVGTMLELHSFYPNLTAIENLELLSLCDNTELDHEKIDRLLNFVSLKDSKGLKVKAFSFGTKQKLAAVSALLNDPDILILDEPFTGLDPNAMDNLGEILRNFADRNGTVFVSSHFLSEIENLCDNLVIINKGKIVSKGNLKNLTSEKSLKRIYLEATENKDD